MPNENVANGWLAAMVLFEAIDRAGTTDKDSVAAELLATDLPADDIALLFHPYPGVKFGQLLNMKNQNIYASPCITQVIDGNMRQVFDGVQPHNGRAVSADPHSMTAVCRLLTIDMMGVNISIMLSSCSCNVFAGTEKEIPSESAKAKIQLFSDQSIRS